MNINALSAFYKFSGFSNILSSILIFISWFSIGIFMWKEISSNDVSAMVQNPAWIPVNVFLLAATMLLIPGIVALYIKQAEKSGTMGLVAVWITILAIIWYTCIQFYETFFWPIIAADSPLLFRSVGFSPSNNIIFIQLMLSAIPWFVGFLLLAIVTIQTNFIAKGTVWIFTIGALLFGVGIMLPMRSIGVILFSYGLIRYGSILRKS